MIRCCLETLFLKKTLTQVTLKENTTGRAELIMNYRRYSDNDKAAFLFNLVIQLGKFLLINKEVVLPNILLP